MQKPQRPCRHAGCANLTRERTGYCAAHAGQHQRWGGVDTRPSANVRYGPEYQRNRARVLRDQPWCTQCGELATNVDHIRALADGGTHDLSNLQPLCERCHRRKSRAEQEARKVTA